MELYINLKALWLESNGLTRIENLAPLTRLRCLYLSKNLIERIEGFESLRELNTLDLSDNRIATLSGLAHLPQLSSLNLSRNLLATSEDLQELGRCAQLTNVDVSHNRIEDPDVLAVLQKVPQLRALRITGNAVVSKTKFFRKVYISSLPQLAFLDRPIFPMERAAVTAWQAGGNEAELQAKRSFVDRENDERRRTLQEFRDWQAQVREKRIRELDEERALKEQQLRDAKENTPVNSSSSDAESEASAALCAGVDAVDLKGFRGITKEQYARLAPVDRAKWDERIERAHADSIAERRQVLGDGVRELGASFWAAEAATSKKASPPPPPTTITTATPPSKASTLLEDTAADESAPGASGLLGHAPSSRDSEVVQSSALSPSAATTLMVVEGEGGGSVAEDEGANDDTEASATTLRDGGTAAVLLPPAPICASRSASHAAVGTLEPPPLPPSTQVLARDPAQFFRDVGEARETWAQLEQRARRTPFVHRPPALPSVHSVRHPRLRGDVVLVS